MQAKGFVNHQMSGALILGAMWCALYLPNLAPAVRLGGWAGGAAFGAFAVGVLAAPILLFFLEGDEVAALLGLIAALLLGWAGARVASSMGASPGHRELVRLSLAAVAPPLLLSGLKVALKFRE